MGTFFCPGTLVEYDDSPQGVDDFMQRYISDEIYSLIYYGETRIRFTVFVLETDLPRRGYRRYVNVIKVWSDVEGVADRVVNVLEHARNQNSVVEYLATIRKKMYAAILCAATQFYVIDEDIDKQEAAECLEKLEQLLHLQTTV